MKFIPVVLFFAFYVIIPSFANVQQSIPESSDTQPNIKILSDQIDCNQNKNVCIAKGNATAEKLNDTKVKILKADQIIAHFAKENGTGPLKVTQLEATGNVFFIIGDIVIQGSRGNYSAQTEIAEVFENVKITNGNNQLDGGYAQVNMKTGQYSIKRNGERVSALIFTKDQKNES
jgi:lipopolysaccharide export system protein LptA